MVMHDFLPSSTVGAFSPPHSLQASTSKGFNSSWTMATTPCSKVGVRLHSWSPASFIISTIYFLYQSVEEWLQLGPDKMEKSLPSHASTSMRIYLSEYKGSKKYSQMKVLSASDSMWLAAPKSPRLYSTFAMLANCEKLEDWYKIVSYLGGCTRW